MENAADHGNGKVVLGHPMTPEFLGQAPIFAPKLELGKPFERK
jgi:hypothetical protein